MEDNRKKGMGSGKKATLEILARFMPPHEEIIMTVEESFEIKHDKKEHKKN